MPTKDELIAEAEAEGLVLNGDENKDEVEAALTRHREAAAALGRAAPLGGDTPNFTPSPDAAVGVQPLTQEDADALN